MARRDEGAYCGYVTEEHPRQPECLGREIDRLSHSRALSQFVEQRRPAFAVVDVEFARNLLERALGPRRVFSGYIERRPGVIGNALGIGKEPRKLAEVDLHVVFCSGEHEDVM